jgi:SAM-dependent methyltransferase
LTRPQRVLHFAPERGLERRLARQPHLDYLSGDLEPGAAMATLDITRLDLPDESFDCVLCYHVLEHVSDDLAAMRELHRVMRPGGWGVVQVPTYGETTVEDPTVTDPAERRERFGQEDHVRLYGRDFLDRLRSAGFEVTVEVFRDSLTPAERARFGLRFDYDLGIDFNELPQAWEVFRCDKPRRV